ncbi:hypothetical protein RchiOBHm_Chr1g0322171 [Rosa chinensis]|uniref:Uncharacterized protein n=1 Tax=Rosa chinensis TaxID=74649 RepID=A0A2P6S9A7_ROSCH|nr:hypothetical protein RchiOBHm_Chr1g0322171 [Rosa chinensis]
MSGSEVMCGRHRDTDWLTEQKIMLRKKIISIFHLIKMQSMGDGMNLQTKKVVQWPQVFNIKTATKGINEALEKTIIAACNHNIVNI